MNKKAIAPLIMILGLVITVFVIGAYVIPNIKLTIVPDFDFAGFTFKDTGDISGQCNVGGFAGNINPNGLEITGNGNNNGGARYIETDVTGVDELLIIYEGYGTASRPRSTSDTSSSIFASIVGSNSGELGASQSVSTSPSDNSVGASKTLSFQPALWKFKNNFDGTWSSMKSLGVGDIFIVDSTQAITGTNQYLRLGVSVGASCNAGAGTAYLKVYNIVRKENSFAVCKADEVLLNNKCEKLTTILLNSEEAIKESTDEKFARVQTELEAKNSGLQIDIDALKEQISNQQGYNDASIQAQLKALQDELKEAQITLKAVQAKDSNVVAVIESQEQFVKPNIFKRVLDSIISFIKNLFG